MRPEAYFGDVWIVRILLQRGIAAIYFVAFLCVVRQFKPLLGEHGLLPVPAYVEGLGFRDAPSIFIWGYSDRILDVVAWTGLVISLCAILGLTERGPIWVSLIAWLVLWVLYLSIVNVGQRFYSFGWESMLLEAGFFTSFLGPSHMQPSVLPVLILRWMLFRTEVGAGLIKLRHDPCWRDLTCLYYHYETQPLPNPLSWYFHRLPRLFHRTSVLFSHLVQVVVPFGLFAPQPIASVAAALIIFHQFWLIVSGNYSWLNWLTAILGVAGLSDRFLSVAIPMGTPALEPIPIAFRTLILIVSIGTVLLSIQPVMNLFSKNQMMNYSYNRFHLVNTYGAFGSVGKERYEILIEGTTDHVITSATQWLEYGFKAKPGRIDRTPPQIAPYHLRLDWLIWFLPFAVAITPRGIHVRGYDVWLIRFIKKLLLADRGVLSLMGRDPFAGRAPAYIRAQLYRYRYTDRIERRETGSWWKRELLGTYLEPLSLEALQKF